MGRPVARRLLYQVWQAILFFERYLVPEFRAVSHLGGFHPTRGRIGQLQEQI
jgi:hypothetical protein